MSECHFLAEPVHDICNVEFPLLLCDFGIEYDMKQQVPEFLFRLLVLLFHDSVAQLVNFFDRHRPECVPSLRRVPRTFSPEFIHNVQHSAELLHFFFFRVFHVTK